MQAIVNPALAGAAPDTKCQPESWTLITVSEKPLRVLLPSMDECCYLSQKHAAAWTDNLPPRTEVFDQQ